MGTGFQGKGMASANLAVGAMIAGRYQVAGLIGRGGMGAVYEARDGDVLCAVKVMDQALVDDQDRRARFEREAKVGESLRGTHIARMFGHGLDERTGLPYIVMERLRGQDLGALMTSRGPFSVTESRDLALQLCDGVAAAHAAGIVHRDLKPGNVFVTVEGTVKVLDFGIAKVLVDSSATSSIVIGTPGWMAPEQLDSDGKITPATDVWAIGLIVYYMLTGREYWLSANTPRDSWAALCKEICVAPIESASARARAQGFARSLPTGFDAWFARCLSREAGERWPDAAEAGRELEPSMKMRLTKTPANLPPVVPGPTPSQGDDEMTILAMASAELRRRVDAALSTSTKPKPDRAYAPSPTSNAQNPPIVFMDNTPAGPGSLPSPQSDPGATATSSPNVSRKFPVGFLFFIALVVVLVIAGAARCEERNSTRSGATERRDPVPELDVECRARRPREGN